MRSQLSIGENYSWTMLGHSCLSEVSLVNHCLGAISYLKLLGVHWHLLSLYAHDTELVVNTYSLKRNATRKNSVYFGRYYNIISINFIFSLLKPSAQIQHYTIHTLFWHGRLSIDNHLTVCCVVTFISSCRSRHHYISVSHHRVSLNSCSHHLYRFHIHHRQLLEQSSIFVSHWSPVNPVTHQHMNMFTPSTQVPIVLTGNFRHNHQSLSHSWFQCNQVCICRCRSWCHLYKLHYPCTDKDLWIKWELM